MNTSDIDWEKTWKEQTQNSPLTHHQKCVIDGILSSRDTYWKERIERVRRDLKARMAHEDYIECVTCDETLYHLDTLLDNLK